MSESLSRVLAQYLRDGTPAIVVTVAEARGSAPRGAGASMVISADAIAGTVGGGRLEFEAMERARAMIATGTLEDRLDMPLGPAVGQCCGGRVVLSLRRADEAAAQALAAQEQQEIQQMPQVAVFGAGHVGQALVRTLAPLPVRVLWNDSRPDALARQAWDNMETHTGDAVDLVARCAPGAAVVVLTPSHALDYAITEAALRRDDLAYVGLIGSATKRRRFERWFTARGGADTALARLVCPIGDVGIVDKRPPIIAAFAATEILRALLRARTGAEQDGRCHETV
jgi:xanthine dehydrogenase accessory factor/xanthine dehydrogenase large subunit